PSCKICCGFPASARCLRTEATWTARWIFSRRDCAKRGANISSGLLRRSIPTGCRCCTPIGCTQKTRRRCCFTATMTCSLRTRWRSGRRRRSSRPCGKVISTPAALRATTGTLPVNIRFLIEGEEEVGGETVEHVVRQHRDKLACDCVVVSDTAMFAPGLPSLDVGLRGMVYAEVEMRGAERDLHSGLYGGVAPNPFEALARVITGLKGGDGHILIPGFYDRVVTP